MIDTTQQSLLFPIVFSHNTALAEVAHPPFSFVCEDAQAVVLLFDFVQLQKLDFALERTSQVLAVAGRPAVFVNRLLVREVLWFE